MLFIPNMMGVNGDTASCSYTASFGWRLCDRNIFCASEAFRLSVNNTWNVAGAYCRSYKVRCSPSSLCLDTGPVVLQQTRKSRKSPPLLSIFGTPSTRQACRRRHSSGWCLGKRAKKSQAQNTQCHHTRVCGCARIDRPHGCQQAERGLSGKRTGLPARVNWAAPFVSPPPGLRPVWRARPRDCKSKLTKLPCSVVLF